MIHRKALPNRRRTETHKIKIGRSSVFFTLGYYEDGAVGEVFIDTAKAGTVLKEMMGATGKLVSLALQLGATPAVIAGILKDKGATEKAIPHILADLILEECVHPDDRQQPPHQTDVTVEPVP